MTQIGMQHTGRCARHCRLAPGPCPSAPQIHRSTHTDQSVFARAYQLKNQNFVFQSDARVRVTHGLRETMLRASPATAPETPPAAEANTQSYICTSVTATTVEAFIAEIQEAAASGVDIIELRLDFLTDLDPELHLQRIISSCPLPYIITYRPVWEG
jgi:hypothetical protein